MSIVTLALVSFVSWFISTLAGGGSPLLLIPFVNFTLGAAVVPPIITIGMLLGNFQRIILFWQHINWKVTLWYLPGGIAGAVLGAYTFTQLHLEWLQLLIGLFIVISVFSFEFGQQERIFQVEAWHFLPAGFFYAFISGIIGSSGPVLNPFYLNYGLVKEDMIATKSTNVVVIHIAKILTYAVFSHLDLTLLGYGLIIGIAAFPANLLGRYILRQLNEGIFRQFVLVSMGITGGLMVWQQREIFIFW
jgi:uncharacterized membrane protein YfcA